MKMILALAAAALVGVAGAADCTRTITPTKTLAPQGGVYAIKMNLRTTKGVAFGGSTTVTTTGSVCARTSTTNKTDGCVYRTTDSLTIDGWIVECTNSCKVVENSKVVYAWATSRKTQIDTPKFTWTFINQMGKNLTDAEAFGSFSGGLVYNTSQKQKITAIYLAGQGKYNGSYYTSLAGNAAGSMTASYDLAPNAKIDAAIACVASKVWTCDTTGTDFCAAGKANETAVYGSWSIRYNASASAAYFKKGTLSVPAYVTVD